jgi:UDP-N-acetylmuramate--alanine ligase
MLKREEWLNLDISKLKKVHFIGINSGFNSFCANYLLSKGVKVTASEITYAPGLTEKWIERGVLYPGSKHNAEYVTDDLDLVVFPNGPLPENPECIRAGELNIPSITIGQMTGLVSKNFKTIAVAGTQGKTTTTSLIIWMLKNALGQLPNFIVGDTILEIDSDWNYNPNSEDFVVEACEYKRQFLDRAPHPFISVITNIGFDHSDYYHDQKDYNSAFSEFLSNSINSIVIDKTADNSEPVLRDAKLTSDIRIVDTSEIAQGCLNIDTPLYGEHNRQNLLRACGVADVLNIPVDLSDFPGIASRFEFKGITKNGMPVYLDYAHNPKKIEGCLAGVRDKYGDDKKVILVWQPHSFERLASFKKEFAESIYNADIVLIPNVFVPTRERGIYDHLISTDEFVKYLQGENPDIDVRYTKNFENTVNILQNEEFGEEYVTVLASAGDLKNILPELNLEK